VTLAVQCRADSPRFFGREGFELVRQQSKHLRIGVLLLVGAVAFGLSIVFWSPEAIVSVFGEWGYHHLISTDRKVKMINDRFSDPDFPLLLVPGGSWSAGVLYAEDLLFCKTLNPPEFVLVDSRLQSKYESAVTWHRSDVFSYLVKGFPIKITIHILEINNGQARVRVVAEKAI
jgi:hypothetical protein